MKLAYRIALLCTPVIGCISAQAATPPDWNEVVRAYIEFSSDAYPTSQLGVEQGKRLLDIMPQAGTCNGQDSAIPNLMIDSDYFRYLSKKAYSGNAEAAEVLFRLSALVCGDAEHSESMDITIGNLIRPQPQLFLSLLDTYGRKNLSGVLGNLGGAYVDKPTESAKELQLRYDALASVKNVAGDLQQRCLKELKQDITRDTQH